MPPASSPGSDLALSRATTRERAARVRYRRALMLMTMTLVVPGSAQLAAGNRQVGRIAIRIWLVLVAIAVLSIPTGSGVARVRLLAGLGHRAASPAAVRADGAWRSAGRPSSSTPGASGSR